MFSVLLYAAIVCSYITQTKRLLQHINPAQRVIQNVCTPAVPTTDQDSNTSPSDVLPMVEETEVCIGLPMVSD